LYASVHGKTGDIEDELENRSFSGSAPAATARLSSEGHIRGRTRFDVELIVSVLRVEDPGLASIITPGKPISADSKHEFALAA
jgi:hypothetical protein